MDENPVDPISNNTADVDTANHGDLEEAKPADVLLTADGKKFLYQTRPWVRFLSIMAFIGACFMVLGGVMMLFGDVTGNLIGTGSESSGIDPKEGIIFGLVFMILSVMHIAPGVFLFRYASAIKILESTCTSQALEKALKFQRTFWRYVGVLTVIGLVVMAAAIAFPLAVAIFMYLNR